MRLCEAETLQDMPPYLIEAKRIELKARDIYRGLAEERARQQH